ncbi:Hypothetical predicted protein [Mytilus galloprovincialis]|uniref:B box-type domain-containing protein n=1 Tax=Mytilus galloprovincialis TaxID=29158 RepID=A0A8B6DS67_MYTGA|nr:Hypothetical predicted protein [Mytilus galloprovincialis]
MAANTGICGICSLRQITQTSNHWCQQCEEPLCDECRDNHKLLKVTRSHDLIPISDYKSIPSFITDIQQSCIYHNEQYQQYCVEHALPICFKCINDHRKCNVTTLEQVTNNVKTSEKFLDLESRLDDLSQNIDIIKKDRNYNVTNIEQMKTKLGKAIRQKRAEINKHLDNLEKIIVKDLEEKECQSKERIKKVISLVKEKETIISQCQTDFLSIKQYASNLQTFFGITEIEVKVYENEQYLHSLGEDKSLEQVELVWKEDPAIHCILSSLRNFGSIELKTQTSNIEFTRAKDKQAQLQVVKTEETIDNVKMVLQREISTITTYGSDIRGCCLSEEGDMLFTDNQLENGCLTVIATDNKLKYKMPLGPSCGFDITCIDGKRVAITTGGSEVKIGIDIIDVKKRSKIKFIELPSRTWGITGGHNSLIVCVEGRGIYKINTLDYTTSHVFSCDLSFYSYVAVYTDKIYYTNNKDKSVVCCDCNGSRGWTFKDNMVLNEPGGIAVDNNGNVYVVGEKSLNVVIISSDGKHHKQLLSEDDGLFTPSAIFLDKENKKLLLANTSDTAFVYNISYE